MKVDGGIDLHLNNSVVGLTDEQDKILYRRRLPNDLALIVGELAPFQYDLEGLVVESAYNWYWLVDGLIEADYRVCLAKTVVVQQYECLKYADDNTGALWLAKLARLGQLPEGYIYPKADRAIRGLLRKRLLLVQQPAANLLSVQSDGCTSVLSRHGVGGGAQPHATDL